MMISTRGRYALRFLVDLAEHPEGFVPLRDVASRQEISEKYLEIVVKALVRHGGMVVAMRGKGGGYRLSRAPEEYGVKEVLEVMEGPLVPVACLEPGGAACLRKDGCRTLPLWEGLGRVISDYLERFTIADLCRQEKAQECGAEEA